MSLDAGTVGDDATVFDVAVTDVPGRDIGREAHVCPVVDDVATDDVPMGDAPYVVELAIGAQLHGCAHERRLGALHGAQCGGPTRERQDQRGQRPVDARARSRRRRAGGDE
jgi:hypothetical protein